MGCGQQYLFNREEYAASSVDIESAIAFLRFFCEMAVLCQEKNGHAVSEGTKRRIWKVLQQRRQGPESAL